MFEKISVNIPKESGECYLKFREIFEKIPVNNCEDSRECTRRFWRMLLKITITLIFNNINIIKN